MGECCLFESISLCTSEELACCLYYCLYSTSLVSTFGAYFVWLPPISMVY